MARIITFKISGHGADNDAPTADDWLDQIRDYLDILRGVEDAIAEDGQRAIDWRVVNASKNSPIAVQLQPFARQYAVNIDRRVEAVVTRTASGLAILASRPERPPFFNDKVLVKAEKTFARVTNGLDLSEIDFGDDLPKLPVTKVTAQSAVKNVQLALTPAERPFKELAAVEGFVTSVERDGYGRRILWLRHRITGNTVKCLLSGAALSTIEQQEISEVFKGRRLLVSGVVDYKAVGNIAQIHADKATFFPVRSELPTVDDILDEDFTGGLISVEYLAKLRDGQLS
jgi:hypothetical protein